MQRMYCNLARNQAFPMAFRISLEPGCFKQVHTQKTPSLPVGSRPKPLLNPVSVNFTKSSVSFNFTKSSHGFHHTSHKAFNFEVPARIAAGLMLNSMEMGSISRTRSISSGLRFRRTINCSYMLRARSFFGSYMQRVGEVSGVARTGKSLPWLSSNKQGKGSGSKSSSIIRGPSFKRLGKVSSASVHTEKGAAARSSWGISAEKLERKKEDQSCQSSWEHLAQNVSGKSNSGYMAGNKDSRTQMAGAMKDTENSHSQNGRDVNVDEGEGEEESEVIDDPRWNKIKSRFMGVGISEARNVKPEMHRWTKQENWGRKTWKEATESTVPKMVGEGVYGVGPVLAALSARRREFYVLYVQEGVDLNTNNRKKKDKKGFEKVLRIAQNIGLKVKEISKHDLNMVADNRPHQGLVLDASPLEMVKIKELDPVSPGEEKGSLWVALDEVTDPQNLGAIIRSAYFFGASGVVLCAKNSAPLSGVVSKASAGSLELMELRYCKNMMQFLVLSAENGWRVVGGSVSSKAVPLNEVLPGEPTILVLGSEGTGLRPLVERSCTQLVRIPGNIPVDVTAGDGDNAEAEERNVENSGKEFQSFLAVESLNVSVAAGVLLHHLIGNNHNHNSTYDPE